MVGRRETRREREAMAAILEGKTEAERLRLIAIHRAYLDGERDSDVLMKGPARVPRPARPPPVGKSAAYLAAQRNVIEESDDGASEEETYEDAVAEEVAVAEEESPREKAAVGGKKPAAKKTKAKCKSKVPATRKKAAAAREVKKAKEAAAVARAVSAASKKKMAKLKARLRLEREEKRGAGARAGALAALEQQRQPTREPGKKKRKTSPIVAAEVNPEDASESPGQASLEEVPSPSTSAASPSASVAVPSTPLFSRSRAWSLIMDDLVQEPEQLAATSAVVRETLASSLTADGGMDSELEGESSDSESWYMEAHDFDDEESEEVDEEFEDEVVDDGEDEVSSGTEEQEDIAIEARRRKNEYKQLAAKRLKEGIANLPRDWKETTENWDVLTREEMEVLAQDPKALGKMRGDGWNMDPDSFPEDIHYPDLYTGEYGPTSELLARADSPLDLFFFFMPRSLWEHIAKESNRYYNQHLNERVDRMYEQQRQRGKDETRDEVLAREAKTHKKIKGFEIVQCIGLLLARMLCPHSRRLADHWATTKTGAVPAGTFGRHMSKARFSRILQNLHFSSNTDERAGTDRAWKVRPVVEKLQQTFRAGYNVPPVLAFDEAVIPSRSRHNVTRQYLKDKPHKWGTKLFMTCCADTAYCLRLDVYCGSNQHESELGGDASPQYSADPNSGPAAVIRNLHEILPPPKDGVYHAVVTDRFYTSVKLALQLLARNVYTVGTILTNKGGFPPEVKTKTESRPKGVPRGDTKMAVSKACPQLTVLRWWDRKAVHLLSTGGSRAFETCERRIPGERRVTVPCPSMVRDYQRWMGGVDIHDQLRMQRYSLQLAVAFRKYYKTIFLGLVDMAIVNAYIVFREAKKRSGELRADHAKFLQVLHAQMIELTAVDFANQLLSPGPPNPGERASTIPSEHKLTVFPDWERFGKEGEHRKRPQHQCKVCSLRKQKKGERCATRFFCEACSDGNKRIYLCDRVRPKHYPGNTLTCHQIWHVKWNNGSDRPRPLIGRDIQLRGLGKKRRRSETDAEEAEEIEVEDAE